MSVVLPNRAKYFSKTLTVKTVNDKSSQTLAAMGLEKKLDVWLPPDPIYNQLRQLTPERDQLKGKVRRSNVSYTLREAEPGPTSRALNG